MLRTLQITTALSLGIALAGCNRSTVQPVPAPSVPTSSPVDQVPPAQDTDLRVDAARGNVDIQVERDGILGDRKIEIKRDADNAPLRDRPLLDRGVDVQVVPGQGVKVDLGK